jgi:hypothetical protein
MSLKLNTSPTFLDLFAVLKSLHRHVWSKAKIQAVELTEQQEMRIGLAKLLALIDNFSRNRMDDQRAFSRHDFFMDLFERMLYTHRMQDQRASFTQQQ